MEVQLPIEKIEIVYMIAWAACIVGAIIFLRLGSQQRDLKKVLVGVGLAFTSVLFGYYYSPLKSSDFPEIFKVYVAAIFVLFAITVYKSYRDSYSGVYDIEVLKDKTVVVALGIAGSIMYIALFGIQSFISYVFTYVFAFLFIIPIAQMIRNKQIDVRRAFSVATASIVLPVIAYVASYFGIEIDVVQPIVSAVVLSFLLVPIITWFESKI